MSDAGLEPSQLEHSPLGASSAERWMNCPGSVALIKGLALPESDEADWRVEGTAAHHFAAVCLREKLDAWEVVAQTHDGVECNQEIADSVQVYLDEVRPLMVPHGQIFIEHRVSSPRHRDFYGTLDFGCVADSLLTIRDFKHGAGVVVDVEENSQLKYYAYGLLQKFPDVRRVSLGIVQPRAYHPEGVVRRWTTDAENICDWVDRELLPAMERTAVDGTLDAGPWCRFCPAKLVCPMLSGLFAAACETNPQQIVNLTNASLGREYQYVEGVKMYIKALQDETFRRLNTGQEVEGTKLVPKKANRVFKDGAESLFRDKFGDQIFTLPELRSPAEMEKLGHDAKQLVREWAYTPLTGYTVALSSDRRPAVKVQTGVEVFKDVVLDTPA